MLVKERILNHAPRLENTVKFLADFISGLTTEKPFFWQGMAICPFKNNNIVFKPHSLENKFDSVEIFVARQKEKGTIILNSSLFENEIGEIVNTLICLKEQIFELIENSRF